MPSPFNSGAGEGVGTSQFRRGDRHCGTLYIYVLYATPPLHFTHNVSELNSRHNPALTNLHWSPSCSLVLEDDIGWKRGRAAWEEAGEEVEEGWAEDQVHWPANRHRNAASCHTIKKTHQKQFVSKSDILLYSEDLDTVSMPVYTVQHVRNIFAS